jgi:2-phospho-L-lactate guanylyltransferase (CobY/MobA/RfbA family)
MNHTMQDLSDDERKQVLGEVLMDELKAIREYVQDVPLIKADVQQLKADVTELKTDMRAVKAAVKDYSRQQAELDARVTQLEQAA